MTILDETKILKTFIFIIIICRSILISHDHQNQKLFFSNSSIAAYNI